MAKNTDNATEKVARRKKIRTDYDNLVKIGDYYYVDFYKKGRGHLQRSTGETRIGRANDIKIAMINDFLGKKPVRKLFEQSLIETLKVDHLALKQRHDRPATFESRSEKWRLYLGPFFDSFTPYEVADKWEDFIDFMDGHGVGVGQSRKHLITFLGWCVEKGHLDRVPKLRNPDPDAEEGRVYTPAEMESLSREASEEGPDFYLNFLMSRTMYTRAGENNIPWDRVKFHLDPPQLHLKKEDTKTKKPRKFAISRECMGILFERKRVSKSPFIFPHPDDKSKKQYREWYDKPWERVKERAGITGRARFHDIRHTAITYAVKRWPHLFIFICEAAGLDPKVAQKIYLHLTPKDTAVIMSPLEGI